MSILQKGAYFLPSAENFCCDRDAWKLHELTLLKVSSVSAIRKMYHDVPPECFTR